MFKNIPEFKGTVNCGISTVGRSKSNFSGKTKDDAQKHEEAERRRLESNKRQRDSYNQKQNLISSALKSIDRSASSSVNKKIKFSSSSSSDQDSDDDIPSVKPKSIPKSHVTDTGKKKLFDDDDEDDGVDFQLNTEKFDGAVGSKLLELQAKFGGIDQRFKMDIRFLDDANETVDKAESQNEKDELVLKAEKRSNMRILEKVLGKPLPEVERDESPKKSSTVPYLRYDPDNPSHRQFQITHDDEESSGGQEEPDQESPNSSSEEEPEIDSEVVANSDVPVGLNSDFADRLRQRQTDQSTATGEKPDSSGFSLRQLFGRDSPFNEDSGTLKNAVASSVTIPSWRLSLTKVRESSSENEEGEDEMPQINSTVKEKPQAESKKKKRTDGRSLFFFYEATDERISGEGEKFRRTDDIETVRAKWEKQRYGYIEFYKSRRKEALKKQRIRKEREEGKKGKRFTDSFIRPGGRRYRKNFG